MTKLTPREVLLRIALLVGASVGALGLRVINPSSLSWLPLRPSCGAATGLPCIFCGTPRALHHLLNGDFAGALYFNWLAFPVAAVVVSLGAVLAVEIARGKRVAIAWPRFHVTRRSTALVLSCVVALWILQVSLAVGFHKQELLNPRGVLYRLLLK